MNSELGYVKVGKDFADIDKLIALFESAFPPEERFASTRDVLDNIDRIPNTELIAAYDGDTLVGFYVMSGNFDMDYRYLQYFAVDSSIRGKGYGGRILRKLLEDNRDRVFFASIEKPVSGEHGYEIKLRRQRFYERNGMVTVQREHVQRGVPFIAVTNRTGEAFDRCHENEMAVIQQQIRMLDAMIGRDK